MFSAWLKLGGFEHETGYIVEKNIQCAAVQFSSKNYTLQHSKFWG